jgi:hypothetical protein
VRQDASFDYENETNISHIELSPGQRFLGSLNFNRQLFESSLAIATTYVSMTRLWPQRARETGTVEWAIENNALIRSR